MNIGEILVRFGAETSGLMGGIRAAIGALGSFGAAAVAAGLIVGGLAVVMGVLSVNAAANFQQGLNRLVTGAGDVTDNMQRMGRSILGISVATGVLTGQLLPAMYQIISAGQRGATAEGTLGVAARGAVAEQAKVVDVAKALTTAMTDYGTTQFNATQFMNGYTRATQLGKLSLEELSTSMGPILPLAKNMGISFADVAGAMSTMTNAGIPAERAATSLRFLFQSLEVPTTKAKNAMQAMGLSSVAVGNELKTSLPGALEMIYKAALRAGPEGSVPFNRAVSDMIGGQRSLQAFLALTGSHFATYVANAKAVADAMNASKTAVLGWDTAQSNFNVKVNQGKAVLEALAIVVGSAILPYLSQLADMVIQLLSRFTQWVVQSHIVENAMHTLVSAIGTVVSVGASIVAFFQRSELALAGLKGVVVGAAVAIGVALAMAFYSLAVAAGAAAIAVIAATWPFLAIGAAVAIVVAAFIHFYNTSAAFRGVVDQIVGVLKQLWATLLQVGAVIIGNIGPAITIVRQFFVQLWATLQQGWAILLQVANAVIGLANSIGAVLMPFLRMIASIIVANFLPAWRLVVQTLVGLGPVVAQLGGAMNMLGATIMRLWSVLQPGLALLVDIVGRFLMVSQIGRVLMSTLEALGAIIAVVLVTALAVLVGVITGVATAFSYLLLGVTLVVAGVTRILTGLIQFVTGFLALFIDLFTGNWSHLAADTGMMWQGIVNIVTGALQAILGIIVAIFGTILGFVMGFVQGFIGFFVTLYHELVGGSIVPDMCAGILNAFLQMGAAVLGFISGFIANLIGRFVSLRSQALAQLSSLVSSAASVLSQLAGIAARAGQAMISALVGQINAGVGWVSSAINNVVAAIGNVLPHSPAKEGPLRDLNKFGPTITHGLAAGILAGSPEVRAAVNMMVQPFKAPMNGGVGATGTGGGRGTNSPSDNRPIIIQIGAAEYRGFVQNLGRDLSGTIVLQRGGMR